MTQTEATTKIRDVALRIWELREVSGFTNEEMAEKLGLSVEMYLKYESGEVDLPFSFIHNAAILFGVELTDLLEGWSAHLTSYSIIRKGKGRVTSHEKNIEVRDLAPRGLAHVASLEDLVAVVVDHLTLLVEHIVVLERVLAHQVVLVLDLLLRLLDLLGEHAGLDRLLVALLVGRAEPVEDLVDPLAREQSHQVVLRAQEEP